MEHLLARLAIDSPSVSRRIVDLLFKSFFPVNESEREWCCRCVTLIQMNPMAARKFYQFAHRHTAPTNISKTVWKAAEPPRVCVCVRAQTVFVLSRSKTDVGHPPPSEQLRVGRL